MPRMSNEEYEKSVKEENKITERLESYCPKCGYRDPAGRSLENNGGCPCDNWEVEEDDRL